MSAQKKGGRQHESCLDGISCVLNEILREKKKKKEGGSDCSPRSCCLFSCLPARHQTGCEASRKGLLGACGRPDHPWRGGPRHRPEEGRGEHGTIFVHWKKTPAYPRQSFSFRFRCRGGEKKRRPAIFVPLLFASLFLYVETAMERATSFSLPSFRALPRKRK